MLLHWFVDSIYSWRENAPMDNAVGQRALSGFHNNDFGDNKEATFVDHDISVFGDVHKEVTFKGIEDASGEASLLFINKSLS